MPYIIESHDNHYLAANCEGGRSWIKTKQKALRFGYQISAQSVIDMNRFNAKTVKLKSNAKDNICTIHD